MAQLLIEGGSRLVGRVPISGSKNAVLPILAACLLTDEECRLKNVPRIEDVSTMTRLLEAMGVQIRWLDPQQLQVNAQRLLRSEVLAAMANRMRASFLLMGPLLARRGEARVAKPGGDDIGMRRVEQHLRGLRLMGARVELEDGEYVARADRLRGATIHLDMPTVTGTENLMMAAATADGITTIHNAAREPHVVDLAMFLGKMGARIHGIGSDILQIEGVPELSGATHRVIPDNIEAGTYAFAIAATGGEAVLEDVETADLRAMMLKLGEAGVEVEDQTHSLWVKGNSRLQPVDVTTWPHPGFPTDLQAPFVSLMTQAQGRCVVSEAVFENRFQHVPELRKLGADIYVEGRSAIVSGPSALHGAAVTVPDIRSGAALVVAALCAEGTTALDNIYHLDRGYQELVGKLEGLGAHVTRVDGEAGDVRPDLSRVVGD
ncbi:MAG: UDP-N-acetylglucosamine 1-carboxyvinyltransferase [Chloroflexi bacterium]|nr:MAG: UDP-N-acetylglucosamine 1-carboxyvinyltransferase [Chloroflexota bacterium]TME52576.1 MAG: UDP-N-acetylglucosamine 1-carboxyvinyltransferase [Chloroflexota bacterium]